MGDFGQPGVACPDSSNNCVNFNAEPQIASSPSGTFYASSEFLPPTTICGGDLSLTNPACGGTGAWASTDGGRHYVTLPSPNAASVGGPTLSAWGGDTDIAVAPLPNTNGQYSVYVSSLERAVGPLLSVAVSTSGDGGQTWRINPAAASVPGDDRPWIAADGANTVCLSYYAEALEEDAVECSANGGITFGPAVGSLDSSHLWLTAEVGEGNLAIDPSSHAIYVVFPGLLNEAEAVQCAVTCGISLHALWVAVSTNGGASFTDHLVYSFANPTTSIGHQFPMIGVDKLGNVYTVFCDNHNIYLSHSRDFGGTWSPAVRVNAAPSNTSVMPWFAAGAAGALDIVWYGTSYANSSHVPDNFPVSAAWYVYFAQTWDALAAAPTFTQTTTGEVVHYGGVCEGGISCNGNQTANRDLFDDFGVAASPTTGLASIVYSDDQYVGSSTEPASAFCSPAQSNSGNCTRTNIATQATGKGIYGKHPGIDIGHAQLGVDASGQPTLLFEVTDTASVPVTGVTLTLGGVAEPATFSPAMPLAPGAAAWGSVSLALTPGVAATVGEVYPVSVTATLQDGSTAEESFYTLCTSFPVLAASA